MSRFAGEVPLVPEWPGIGKKRFGSIGDWPCFAVTIMVVESRRFRLCSALTICPIAASA